MQTHRTPPSLTTITALIERDVVAALGSHPVGAIWAILEPVLAILILTGLFYIIVPAPPLGDSFALFYATGVIPLFAVQTVSQKMAVALRLHRPLLVFGRVGLFEIALSQLTVALAQQLLAGALVLLIVCILSDWAVVGGFALLLISGCIFTSGVGVLSFWLGGVYQIWPRILAMILRPMVLVSGVFFLIDDIGRPYADWLMWNPVAHLIMVFRGAVYGFYTAPGADLMYPVALGVGAGFVGLVGLLASQKDLLDRYAA